MATQQDNMNVNELFKAYTAINRNIPLSILWKKELLFTPNQDLRDTKEKGPKRWLSR